MEILKAILDNIDDDAPVKEVRRGIFWTAVISRFCGLASTMVREICYDENRDNSVYRSFSAQTALELSGLSLSEDIAKASLGLAAINSLIEIDESRCVEMNAAELLSRMGKGKNISIVGHFPFVEDLRRTAGNLWVIEKYLRAGDHVEGEAEKLLPQSDIIAISSTTLINHTLEPLLSLCPEKSVKMLLGPTTPMSAALFGYGIDIISGSRVIDDQTALKHIGEGANFRELKKTDSVRLISMAKNVSLFKEVVEV